MTPRNLQQLKESEEGFEVVCEKAKTEWVSVTCEKIETCSDPKQKWQEFKKLTSYHEKDDTDVIPLFNENGEVVFDHSGKYEILRKTFGGAHMEGESFDEDFKKEIEHKLHNIKESNTEEGDNFLNRPIMYDEVEASIQRLKRDKVPGPDLIFTDMLIRSSEVLLKAVTLLLKKSWNDGKLPEIWKSPNVKFSRKRFILYWKFVPTNKFNKCVRKVHGTYNSC